MSEVKKQVIDVKKLREIKQKSVNEQEIINK